MTLSGHPGTNLKASRPVKRVVTGQGRDYILKKVTKLFKTVKKVGKTLRESLGTVQGRQGGSFLLRIGSFPGINDRLCPV